MSTAQPLTEAGERLRALLPTGSDPYKTIDLAGHVAFLARDQRIIPGLLAVVKTDPRLAAGLIVALAAMVDIDSRPAQLLSWLGTHQGQARETIRMTAALIESGRPLRRRRGRSRTTVRQAPPEPVRCGTVRGYDAHRKDAETPCPACMAEAARVVGASLPTNSTVIRKNCGSHGGYVSHKNAKEEPCPACRVAQREYDAEQYDKRLKKKGLTRVGRGRRRDGTQPLPPTKRPAPAKQTVVAQVVDLEPVVAAVLELVAAA